MNATTMARYGPQRGAGMVETMVGIAIGLVVVLVIYNIFALAEGYKRTAIGVADAQVTGQFAQFVLSREIASAGNGIAISMPELATCNNDPRLKPIPVLITDGGDPNSPDSFIAFYSNATRVVSPVLFTAGAAPPAFRIQSPNGFAVNDWVIASDKTNNCFLTRVTNVSAPPSPAGGEVDVTTAPAIAGFNAGWRLINLGRVSRVQYTVDPVKRQLYSQDVNWQLPAVQPVVPLAQNIMLLKAQYGVDTDGNGTVNCWTSADASNTCGAVDYSAAALGSAATTSQTINRIRAVRIAIVVRSDEPDTRDAALTGQTATLFNCSANTNAACQGRLQIDDTVLLDGYRYRTYETTIPLRNELWNVP